MVDFDYNIFLEDFYDETMTWAGLMFPVLFFMGFILETSSRPPIIIGTLVLASFASAGIFFISTSLIVTTVELFIKIFLMCAVNAITLVVVEAYPCHLRYKFSNFAFFFVVNFHSFSRCTAHGMLRSLFHLASLSGIVIYSKLIYTMLLFPAVITFSLTFFAAVISTRIQDNSKVLL